MGKSRKKRKFSHFSLFPYPPFSKGIILSNISKEKRGELLFLENSTLWSLKKGRGDEVGPVFEGEGF
jgi:hypothetical protein